MHELGLPHEVDRIWDTWWAGGISNPLSVVEQLMVKLTAPTPKDVICDPAGFLVAASEYLLAHYSDSKSEGLLK